jgi:hypothetical protein
MFAPALFHRGFRKLAESSRKRFLAGDLKRDQLAVLRRELKTLGPVLGHDSGVSYQEFIRLHPVTDWSHWAPLVEKERQTGIPFVCPKVKRYQPTSGSTFQRKWIPYNNLFLRELNEALKVWMSDVYDTYPGVREGSHYWSLSWLPEELRKVQDNDDLKFLNPLLQILMRPVMAVPSSVQHAPTVRESTKLTLKHLLNRRDLAFISVWSPTFLLTLLKELETWRGELAQDKEMNSRTSGLLRSVRDLTELIPDLWPGLSLISAWESAESAPWAEEVKKLFPHVPFQGKGLFATEGVVTIPFQGHFPLAYQSHFYEFRRGGEIIPSWELRLGDEVSPVLTTASGLIRYELSDKLEVNEVMDGVPCLTFLGRSGGVDMVGEKMDRDLVRVYFEELRTSHPTLQPMTLMALESRDPGYVLVHQGQVSGEIEAPLMRIHHYKLARELGQLAPLKTLEVSDPHVFWRQLAKNRGMIEGDQKADLLVKVKEWK